MSVNRASADEKKNEKSRKETLLRLIGYMASYRKSAFLVVLIMMVSSIIVVVLPFLAESAIDTMVPMGNVKGLLVLTVTYLLLSLLWWALERLRVRIMSRVSNRVVLSGMRHFPTFRSWDFITSIPDPPERSFQG